jgi:hypothetical protein
MAILALVTLGLVAPAQARSDHGAPTIVSWREPPGRRRDHAFQATVEAPWGGLNIVVGLQRRSLSLDPQVLRESRTLALRGVLRYRRMAVTETRSDQRGLPTTFERFQRLPVDGPVRVELRHQDGALYQAHDVRVTMLPDEPVAGPPGGAETRGGAAVPAYRSWANLHNLLCALPRDGRGTATLFGLAAFPPGSRVSVTNQRLEAEHGGGHSVTVVQTGHVARLRLEARARDRLRIVVEREGHAGAAPRSYEVEVPDDRAPEIWTAHGRGWRQVVVR